MLDLTYLSLIYFPEKFSAIRNSGALIFFCIYDILPAKNPEFFPAEAFQIFTDRLDRLATYADGLICISRTVASEVYDYFSSRDLSRYKSVSIGWFRLGSDISTVPVNMAPIGDHKRWLDDLKSKSFVLMVGTVEPRKGHSDVLLAFEILWAEESPLTLVICGKLGWMRNDLSTRIRKHPEFLKRLFWFEGASDNTLGELYSTCKGVLVASEGEGFGLPLVEAGLHCKPILARDIPVFREVAGECATYFAGGATELPTAIIEWSNSIDAATAPDSGRIGATSWRDSANEFMSLIRSFDNPQWIYEISPKRARIG